MFQVLTIALFQVFSIANQSTTAVGGSGWSGGDIAVVGGSGWSGGDIAVVGGSGWSGGDMAIVA